MPNFITATFGWGFGAKLTFVYLPRAPQVYRVFPRISCWKSLLITKFLCE